MQARIKSPVINVDINSEIPFNLESYTKDNQLVIIITRGQLEPRTDVLPGQISIDDIIGG